MTEVSSGESHEETERRLAAETIGFPALLARIERFHERAEAVASGEQRDDAYFYKSPELSDAYEDARQAGEAVIAACLAYKRQLHQIREIREELTLAHEAETKRRNLGSDVLNTVGVEAPVAAVTLN